MLINDTKIRRNSMWIFDNFKIENANVYTSWNPPLWILEILIDKLSKHITKFTLL